MDLNLIEYLVGMLFVALYAFERINTPKIDMDMTTGLRYWSMVTMYVAGSLLLYFVLARGLGMVGIETLTRFGVDVPQPLNDTSPPILIALVLTVMLPRIPGISKLDEVVRREFRQRASMSRIAGNLSYLIERSQLHLTTDQQAMIIANLKDQRINEHDMVFVNNGTPQYVWTRISILMVKVRQWAADPGYIDFVNAFRPEWETLIETAEKCEAKALRCFRLCGVAENDEALSSALRDCRQHYAEQLNSLLRQLSNFMGRGIACHCGNNPERRRRALVEMGFDIQFDIGYTVHQIAFVIMVVFVVSVLLPPLLMLMGYPVVMIWPFMLKIVAGYAVAAMVALQLHYRRTRAVNPTAERPWAAYLGAGLITVLLTVPFGLLSDVLIRQVEPVVALHKFSGSGYIYHLRPLVMAAMLSYMLDTRVTPHQLRSFQWREAGISALCMAITSWVIILLLGYAHSKNANVHVPKAESMVLSATVIGAVIGFWLPTSTRRIAERVPERTGILSAAVDATDSGVQTS